MWIFNMEYFFWIEIEIFTLFIPQIWIGVSVADYFAWMFNPYRSMVGGDDQFYIFLR